MKLFNLSLCNANFEKGRKSNWVKKIEVAKLKHLQHAGQANRQEKEEIETDSVE